MTDRKAAVEVQFEAMLAERLDAVVAIEQRAYAHPWNRTNFLDALQSGNQAQMLVAEDLLLGYFVAMAGVDEMHLLNITVAPEYQRQGWSRVMLDALTLWARGQSAQWVWLEVRWAICVPCRCTRRMATNGSASARNTIHQTMVSAKMRWSWVCVYEYLVGRTTLRSKCALTPTE